MGSADYRMIRVFLSSPGDVGEERRRCVSVVDEVNRTLKALAPQRGLFLDLFRWETHVHPGAGQAQDVVDAQTGEYDIYVGIMWKRFGSPTRSGESGTVKEFQDAYRGWEDRRSPRELLFYFRDSEEPARDSPEREQWDAVDEFRNRVYAQCLPSTYGTPDEFLALLREHLIGVLGTWSDSSADAAPGPVHVTDRDRDRLREEADRYVELRDSMASGDERTRQLEAVATSMRTLSDTAEPLLPQLVRSGHPGDRLTAACALQVRPDVAYVDWLADRLSQEKPFVAYHAIVALVTAARQLPAADLDRVGRAIDVAEDWVAGDRGGAGRPRADTDRGRTVRLARTEWDRRRGRVGA